VLFFSGGSALTAVSRALADCTHNSIHLITPFDSGGSSAPLREAFGMIGVGDLRSRMVALADPSRQGVGAACALLNYRLPTVGDAAELRNRLDAIVAGDDPLALELSSAFKRAACDSVRVAVEALPPEFDVRGACVGNLVVTGAYLGSGRDIESALARLSELLGVRGTVRPLGDIHMHLAADLADGSRVVGQHRLTGRPEDAAPIVDIEVVRGLDDPTPAKPEAAPEALELIRAADLLCYPVGSFYTSVVANLLPRGVGRAIADHNGPAVYVPNNAADPEQRTMTIADSVEALIRVLRRDAGEETPARDLVSAVLVDPREQAYARPRKLEAIRALGVEVLEVELVGQVGEAAIDARRLADVLVSLAA
jgi:CofD-related protein of GAK system